MQDVESKKAKEKKERKKRKKNTHDGTQGYIYMQDTKNARKTGRKIPAMITVAMKVYM